MQFPVSWLREFCNPDLTDAQLAHALTMAGLEVEDARPAAPPFSGIVVGHLVQVRQHPDADRLRVCLVDAGPDHRLPPSDENPEGLLQIVCGAPNAREGLWAPLAVVGAELPPSGDDGKPLKISKGKLRGVVSHGMLCSARELGISEESSGLLELDPAGLTPGQSVRQALNLDDTLLELKLTPNLGHAFSVYGVARELSAITGAPLHSWAVEPVPAQIADTLPVDIQATDLCGRFSSRLMRGIRPGVATPQWMKDRLVRCGQRPVSLLVDISNYVMFETGQPTHIFDAAKVPQATTRGLTVRWAHEGETLELLNGQTLTLTPRLGIIAAQDGPESLAGIMGGEATSVSDGTCDIVIEAAFWWPDAVAGKARALGFSTEAAHRYERGVSPAQTVAAIERITSLVQQLCGGQAGPVSDVYPEPIAARPVRLRVARARRIIGLPVTAAQCQDVLQRLGFEHSREGTGDDTVFSVTPPPHRFDIRIEEDLIEEVIRLIGYDTLTPQPVRGTLQARIAPENRRPAQAVRQRMAQLGYQETISFSFVEARLEHGPHGNADPIQVLNPIAAPLAVMRSSLIGSLVQVLQRNQARRASQVRVFEWGRVFRRDASVQDSLTSVSGVNQPLRLGGLAWGSALPLQWHAKDRAADFYDAKADIEALMAPLALRWTPPEAGAAHPALHPGRSAWIDVLLPGPDGGAADSDAADSGAAIWQRLGALGELHPQWTQELDVSGHPIVFELDAALVQHSQVAQSHGVARQQGAVRDLALQVPAGVSHAALRDALVGGADSLVVDAVLFDIYRPASADGAPAAQTLSLAWRLHLLDPEATLTDERMDAAIAACLQRAASLGVHLRGQ
ncbi:phenylalanine--tRNA ligase subunit beta [Amphibiibacter pelophylacis]|uniref:Phenylalanine--tRNA ligase subunit beta n=1 Tax=Amphibiibacter pelophylacis TaxID=1799477 RepID=A0ACC6P3I6_9BURK